VLVVNPPSPPGYSANRDSMGGFGQLFSEKATTMPPLDVPYLAGYLFDKQMPMEVLEAEGLDLTREQLAARVREIGGANGSESMLAAVRTSAPTLDWDLSVCAAMKNACPNLAVAIYGPVVPHVLKRLYQEPRLDYIIRGEPDETVWELASGCSEDQIHGLTRRVAEKWVENPPRPFLKELDRLPFPKWELFPYHRYAIPRSSTAGPLTFLPMLSSRGCPFGCHYCPYPVGQGLPWRYRSPKNVVDEIEHLVKDLGIQYILFRDPMFSMRLDRVKQICDEIQRRKLVFRWKCETRPDCLNEETVRAMAAAGCDGINFGVESAEVEIQANVGRKPISRERILEMTGICSKHGIKSFCFFIIGLPGDTVDTILETVEFAIHLRPNWLQFTAATPFIGTKLRQWSIAQGLTSEDEYAYISSHEATVGNENLAKNQVEALHRFAMLIERLINRSGILKDENRKELLYSTGRALADWASLLAAKSLFALGRRHFKRLHWGPPALTNQGQRLTTISAQ
jgi:hypothetical protein